MFLKEMYFRSVCTVIQFNNTEVVNPIVLMVKVYLLILQFLDMVGSKIQSCHAQLSQAVSLEFPFNAANQCAPRYILFRFHPIIC